MVKSKFKSTILYLLKILVAGLVAVAILSLMLFFVSITPIHLDNPKGNTDYVWLPDSIWVNTTEGISFGRVDSDGFNNEKVIVDPDILLVGSSHMEAKNVFYSQSVSGILSKDFEGTYSVYNVGISGHHFYKACQYLPDNLELYKNSLKYIVVETSDINLTSDKVEETLSHTVEKTPSYAVGLIAKLQKIPFIYGFYKQMDGGLLDILLDRQKPVSSTSVEDKTVDFAAYERMFEYLQNIEKDGGVEIIIFYHPTEKFDDDGNIVFDSGESLKAFDNAAKKYGIDFIDMTLRFEKTYDEIHKLPHGFVTGEAGKGHLNPVGHKIIADEIYKFITEKES